MLSLGLPIIGKLLGHTQAPTTARYSHLDADPVRHAADVNPELTCVPGVVLAWPPNQQ